MNTKQCSIIILPTNTATKLMFNPKDENRLESTPNYHESSIFTKFGKLPQHLYIVSNEEIKEGNWFIDIWNNEIMQMDKPTKDMLDAGMLHNPHAKIIASTDLQLFRQVNCSTCDGTGKIVTSCSLSGFTACDNKQCKEDTFKLYLPQIPQSFISLYIEEYNKGNKIEKVEVEYEQYGDVPYYYIYGNCKYECKYKGDWFDLTNGEVEMSKSEKELDTIATKHYYSAFTNPDSTINIKSLKDSWTREEVVNLIHMSHQDCVYEGGTDRIELDKFIKTKLK